MKIPHQRVPPSPHRSQKCHGPTPKEHRQETEAGPRTSWRTFVTNGWLNTASGSSSTVSFLPLPLDLVRSWLHVQTSPKEDLLPSGTYVPERTAILQGNPASEARRPQSPREPGRCWEPAFPSLGLRTGNGLPSLAGGSQEAALQAPKPLRVVGATFISEMPSGSPLRGLRLSSRPFLPSLGQETPKVLPLSG